MCFVLCEHIMWAMYCTRSFVMSNICLFCVRYGPCVLFSVQVYYVEHVFVLCEIWVMCFVFCASVLCRTCVCFV